MPQKIKYRITAKVRTSEVGDATDTIAQYGNVVSEAPPEFTTVVGEVEYDNATDIHDLREEICGSVASCDVDDVEISIVSVDGIDVAAGRKTVIKKQSKR